MRAQCLSGGEGRAPAVHLLGAQAASRPADLPRHHRRHCREEHAGVPQSQHQRCSLGGPSPPLQVEMSPGLTPPARTARHRAPLGATLRLRSRVTMVTGMGPGDPRSHRHRDSVHPGPRAMTITAAGMALDTAGTAVQDTRRSATPVTRPAPTAPPWPHQPRLGAAVSEGTWARLDTLLDPPWPGWVAELLGRGPEMGVHVFSSPHSPQERGPRTEGRADRGARGRGGRGGLRGSTWVRASLSWLRRQGP